MALTLIFPLSQNLTDNQCIFKLVRFYETDSTFFQKGEERKKKQCVKINVVKYIVSSENIIEKNENDVIIKLIIQRKFQFFYSISWWKCRNKEYSDK